MRFFLLSRKADTEFTFDVDLALKQNDENPVFYVQYAHARICSVLARVRGTGRRRRRRWPAPTSPRLAAPSETALLRKLADYPADARRRRRRRWRRTTSRSTCASWRRAFHSYYGAERFLVDDPRAGAGAPGPRWRRPAR